MAMTKAQRRLVNRLLRAFVLELRGILHRLAPARYRRFPKAQRPCHTCAFNPSTDHDQGWDTTAYELMKAISDERPFYCHENLPWRTPEDHWTPDQVAHFFAHRRLCAAYATIHADPATKDAFIRAALLTVNGRRPCQDAIDLATSAIAGAGDVL